MRRREASGIRTAPSAPAREESAGPAEHPLLHLQQTVGNRAATAAAHAGLEVSRPGDRDEVEAEGMARAALGRGPARAAAGPAGRVSPVRPRPEAVPGGAGHPLPTALRADLEPRFGADLGAVRLHAGPSAASLARRYRAAAFTVGRDIVFGAGRYAPGTAAGRGLLAHELAHVVQQGRRGPAAAPRVMRTPEEDAAADAARDRALTAPLSDAEWSRVEGWLARGSVGFDPLTADARQNAELVAESIFCMRLLLAPERRVGGEDPLLCVMPDVTRADPRVQALRPRVEERGPIVHWPEVGGDARMVYVMERLVDVYGYPVNGAAGLVGNLWSESGVIPSRVEGSQRETPLRAANFAGASTDFTPQEVMDRDFAARQGPRRPGVGLAQWTSPGRRRGLFAHVYDNRPAGARILFDMDAQVDYLDAELRADYAGVHATLTRAGVSVNDAADDVLYRFEIPGSILENGARLPRDDARVQAVFARRRANARRALRAYREAHPEPGP